MECNINQQNNLQKFNVEKFYKQNYSTANKINNNNNICQKCHSAHGILHLNEQLIQLLFKDKSDFLDSLNIKICSNCLNGTLNEIYKKDNNIGEMEKEINNLNEICENMSEEKLNTNLRLYNIYKKLVNSFIDYIGDNNNIYYYNIDSFNIKMRK